MNKKVLVVDDEAAILRLVSLILERMGLQVETATNGAEAWQKINNNKPDLVILDLLMPIMSGEELIQEMQGHPETADIPIVLLSTRPSARGYKKDAFPLISKPFSPDELQKVVRQILQLDN